jgi:hypothetical protein
MRRSPMPSQTVPVRRSQRTQGKHARRKDTGPSRKVRALVMERDNYRCVSCGAVVGVALTWWSLQHRKARGQGGDNSPQNLIVLCGSATSPGCHRRAEDRDRESNACGYWLQSWEDPALVPVMLFSEQGSGISAWLTEDGGYSFEPPAGAA